MAYHYDCKLTPKQRQDLMMDTLLSLNNRMGKVEMALFKHQREINDCVKEILEINRATKGGLNDNLDTKSLFGVRRGVFDSSRA